MRVCMQNRENLKITVAIAATAIVGGDNNCTKVKRVDLCSHAPPLPTPPLHAPQAQTVLAPPISMHLPLKFRLGLHLPSCTSLMLKLGMHLPSGSGSGWACTLHLPSGLHLEVLLQPQAKPAPTLKLGMQQLSSGWHANALKDDPLQMDQVGQVWIKYIKGQGEFIFYKLFYFNG
jgi:hypothetical protein